MIVNRLVLNLSNFANMRPGDDSGFFRSGDGDGDEGRTRSRSIAFANTSFLGNIGGSLRDFHDDDYVDGDGDYFVGEEGNTNTRDIPVRGDNVEANLDMESGRRSLERLGSTNGTTLNE